MTKPVKTVRRTIVVVTREDVPVSNRALMWELSGRNCDRFVHRVERATAGAGNDADAGEVYLIDAEVTKAGASRHDLTMFVRKYLPEVVYHYITE
jgi:hypothetical protein